MKIKILVTAIAFILLIGPVSITFAQTTAFNFQGRLNDGSSPANGRYDLQFKLFDSITGGSPIGPTNERFGLTLVNGVFSTTLDYGASAYGGGFRFLEIGVKPFNSPNGYVVLGARQQIMSVPLAVRSTSAANADTAASAVFAETATTAGLAQNSLALGGFPPGSYVRINVPNAGNVVADGLASNNLLHAQGNATQGAVSNGFPKMMLAITANGVPARCYNGVTGAATDSCGLVDIGVDIPNTGAYTIVFPFNVSNRFWLVSNNELPDVTDALTATVLPVGNNPNALKVRTFRDGTPTPLPFHLFVF